MKRPLCPVLLIGFAPPEEGKRDLRRCTYECAWFDENMDQCILKTIASNLEDVSAHTSDHLEAFLDVACGIPVVDDENYEYNATSS